MENDNTKLKYCSVKCVKNNNKICCYSCDRNNTCKEACIDYKEQNEYDYCFYREIKIEKKRQRCTGPAVSFERGVKKIKKPFYIKIKIWVQNNISWRFKRYPPEE